MEAGTQDKRKIIAESDRRRQVRPGTLLIRGRAGPAPPRRAAPDRRCGRADFNGRPRKISALEMILDDSNWGGMRR